ncbi:hypothetical protein HRH25_02480 [Flavisolibacter sp. BT320]|nr:hypothetical protein [Flavisolibacter longurius]
MTIQERLLLFKTDIREEKLNPEEIFQKHLIELPTYFFQGYLNDPSLEYTIKSLISKTFSTHIREVLIVGSGKLGFSLKPNNLFNEFDSLYSRSKLNKDKSDLDIAVISNSLYESIGRKLYNYTAAYRDQWRVNEYYSEGQIKRYNVPICYKYFEYYTKGWFRPDFKPQGFEFCVDGKYQDLKGLLYKKLNRKVGIAIYQNWFYFMDYHLTNINNLRYKLNSQTL